MKKIMASILAASMIMSAGTATTFIGNDVVLTVSAATEGTYETLEYTAYDAYVAITGFDGTSTEVEIPAEIEGLPVTSIANNAFYGATKLEKITIPEGVETIGDNAFYNCTSLSEINLPNTLKKIQWKSFQKCISLNEIDLPESLAYIGSYAFSECAEIKKITFPKKVERIPENVCYKCLSLEEVTIENGASEIAEAAFEHCLSLSKIYIPLSVTSIDTLSVHNAFYYCPSITDVYYAGTENQWKLLNIYLSEFDDATIHFEVEELPKSLTPDINCDGSIDASDASLILTYYAYIMTGGTDTIEKFMTNNK